MPDLPKPAYDRLRNDRLRGDSLRAGTPAQPHPDADLLTAFAEQALLVSERDAILEHLSLCGDCREIISLALPATDAAAAPVFVETGAETGAVHAVSSDAMAKRGTDAAPHARMRGWPSLRWAALAAGVIVAASVFLVRPGSLNQPAAPIAVGQIATTASPSNAVAPSPGAASSPTAPPAAEQAKSQAPLIEFRKSKTEAAASQAGSAAIVIAPNGHDSTGNALMAKNEAPAIEKAKAPLPGSNTSWTITGGVLERSLDNGQTWQTAVHANHPLVCYATHGDDIWAGGEVGTLFRSTDDGQTWQQIQPSIGGQSLTGDITRIELQCNNIRSDNPQADARITQPRVELFTSNNQVWTSPDGGKSWNSR